MTLKTIATWTSPGAIDFDNSRRTKALTQKLDFTTPASQGFAPDSRGDSASNGGASDPPSSDFIHLQPGSYLASFNETVSIPLDTMGQLFVRSSLFGAGAMLNAGLVDSGYEGAMGALLQVLNPHGLKLYRDAKLAQLVCHKMTEPVEGYQGLYESALGI